VNVLDALGDAWKSFPTAHAVFARQTRS